MRRLEIALFHTAVLAIGIFAAFHPTLTSGFARLQTDPGDTLLNHYILEHTWKCVSEPSYAGSLWSPPCFYPTQGTLAYSENLLGSAPIYWGLRTATDELTAYQVWMIAVCALTYASTAWTLGKFGVGPMLAALGAFVFAFGLPRVNQLGHQQLLPAFYSPPAIYFTWRFLERPRVTWLVAVLALVTLQLLAGVYLGWFLALGIGCFAGVSLLVPKHRLISAQKTDLSPLPPGLDGGRGLGRGGPWHTYKGFLRSRWRAVSAAMTLAAIILGATFWPYVAANQGFKRSYREVRLMLPRPTSWLSPAPASAWSEVLPHAEGPLNHEHHNFPGATMTVLFAGALIGSMRRGGTPAVAKWAVVTAGLLIGMSLAVDRISAWRLIYALVPGAKAIRAVARIFTIVGLFVAIGSLVVWQERLRRWGRAGTALAGLLLLVGMAEQWQPRLPSFDPAAFYAESGRLAVELRGARAAYVELDPGATFWMSQLAAMWAGLKADVPVVNGYSGRTPPGYPDEKMLWEAAELNRWLGERRGEVRIVAAPRLAGAYPAPEPPPDLPALEFRPYRPDRRAER